MDKDQIFGLVVFALFFVVVIYLNKAKHAEGFRKSSFYRIYGPLIGGLYFTFFRGIIKGDKVFLFIGICSLGVSLYYFIKDRKNKSR